MHFYNAMKAFICITPKFLQNGILRFRRNPRYEKLLLWCICLLYFNHKNSLTELSKGRQIKVLEVICWSVLNIDSSFFRSFIPEIASSRSDTFDVNLFSSVAYGIAMDHLHLGYRKKDL